MSTSATESARRVAVDVEVTAENLTVHLDDGRVLSVPLVWYPRLADAKWRSTRRGRS